MNKLVTVFVLIFAAAYCQTQDEILEAIDQYELSQNTRNASLCASLFTPDGVVYLPLGTKPLVGTDDIYNGFSGFFNEVDFIQEYLLGTPKINAGYAGVAKMFFTQIGKCPVALEVITMFEFDEDASITQFSAIWNTTDFNRQATC